MIYGIILAAGLSSRMGQPKQLLEWRGKTLVRHITDQALASGLAGLIVVLGAAADACRAALADLHDPRLQLVENPEFATGQATSLRCGIAALPADASAALVLLVDQPLVTPALIATVIAAGGAEWAAVVPRYRGQRGNPVLLGRELFSALLALQGDAGARTVLGRIDERLRWLDLADPAVVVDVDTPEAWAAALSLESSA